MRERERQRERGHIKILIIDFTPAAIQGGTEIKRVGEVRDTLCS